MRSAMLALGLWSFAGGAMAADWRPLTTSTLGDRISIDAQSIYGPPDQPQAQVRFDFAKPDRRGAVRAQALLKADCRLGQIRALDGGEFRANGTATVRAVNRPGNWAEVAGRPSGKAILDALCWTG
jgi:hypothetical protein